MKTKISPGAVLINRDGRGNTLIFKLFNNGNASLSLKLLSETRTRELGAINVDQGVLYVTRSRIKHLHVKTMSYGLNDFILRTPPVPFSQVVVTDQEGSYRIPVADIFTLGKYLIFKQSGFERQIFIQLEVLKKYEI